MSLTFTLSCQSHSSNPQTNRNAPRRAVPHRANFSLWLRLLCLSLCLLVGGGTGTPARAAVGALDATFNGTGTVITPSGSNVGAAGVAIQSDGKIVAVGKGSNGSNNNFMVVRYNSNGSLDTTFNGSGIATTSIGSNAGAGAGASAVAIQSGGKIVVAGFSADNSAYSFLKFTVVRYNSNGSLDTTFNGSGIVITPVSSSNDIAFAVALQSDGKIVVTGTANSALALVRYNSNGSLDTTFNSSGIVTTPIGSSIAVATGVALQSDGKIVAAGYSYGASNAEFTVVRYNSNGSLDTTFNGSGIVITPIGSKDAQGNAIALQSDGKIVVAGSSKDGSFLKFTVARYNSNGSLDTTFNGSGIVTTLISNAGAGSVAAALALQSDGKIVAAGKVYLGSSSHFVVARYNSDGSLDTTFNGSGTVSTSISNVNDNDVAYALALQSDGKIVAAGNSISGGVAYFALARYIGINHPPTASNQSATTNEDTTLALTLTGADADNDALRFKLTSLPAHGQLYDGNGTTTPINAASTATPYVLTGDMKTVTYVPTANYNGGDSFTFKANDGSVDSTASATASLTVNAVADIPSVTNAITNEVTQTATGLVITRNPADGTEVPYFKITAITNGNLFQNDGVTVINNGDFITVAQGNAGLKFTPNNGTNSGSFNVQAATSNSDAGLGGGTVTATITVQPVADLSVTNVDATDPVNAGDSLTYTVTVANNGPSDAANVTLADNVPANTTFVSFTQTAGTPFSTSAPAVGGTGAINATLATLTHGTSATFQLVVQVNASTADGTTLNSTASATTTTTDSNSNNNSALATTTASTDADVSVTNTDGVSSATAGNATTYTFVVTNNGPSDAQSVSFTNAVPTGATFVSATQTAGPNFILTKPAAGSTGTFSGNITTLAANASATFTLTVQVNAAATGSLSDTDAVTTTTNDNTSGNDSALDTDTIEASADLSVTNTDGVASLKPSATTTYTVTVINNGPSDAQSVSLIDTVPTGATFVSATQSNGPAFTLTQPTVGGTGDVTATLGALAAGARATFQISVQVNANAADGTTLNHTATVSATTTDAVTANNSVTDTDAISTGADVSVSNEAAPNPVSVGGNLTYTITLHNSGPGAATGVSLNDTLPAHTTFVSLSQTSGPAFAVTIPTAGSGGTVTANASSLAANADAIFSLVVKVDFNLADQAVVSDTATAVTTTTDANPGNNSGTATVTTSNQAPIIAVPVAQITNAGVPLTFSIAAGTAISVSDAEAGGVSLPLTIGTTQGTFALGSTAGLTANNASSVSNVSATLSGPLTALNNALNGLVFTPDANFSGAAALTLTLSDGINKTTRSVSITVNAVNAPPVAADRNVTTLEDTATAITLAATDVDSPTLTYAVVTLPTHGTLSGTAPNLTYTPATNYNGSDSFSFKANDGALDSNVATVNITVTPVNDAPVAQDDAYTTSGLQPLVVAAPGVLGNDTDLDGDALHAVVVTQPVHGTLTLNDDGSFTYAPAIGYNGLDSFTYQVKDGGLASNVATVTLNIGGNPGQSVTLGLASSAVKEGTPVTGTLILSRPAANNVTVTLLSSQPGVATVPTQLIILAGQTSGSFTLTTLKNPLATGPQSVIISANVGAYGTAAASLTVTDNEIATLTLAVAPAAINENYGPAAALATISRNTPTVQPLRVTLLNNNPKVVKLPAAVVIPAGAASTTFLVAALDNRIVNKAQTALLTARAGGYKDGTAKLTVADNGKVTCDLKLTLATGLTYIERAGGQVVTGTVSLVGKPLIKNLIITLISSDARRVSLPKSVLLKAGQSSVKFSFRILDNLVADGPHSVWLTARAATYGTSALLVTIQDNDGAILSLTLSKTTAAANVTALTATLTRLHVPIKSALSVTLGSSDKTRVTVPATITIPAGKAAVTFKVTVKHSTLVTSSHAVTIVANKLGLVAGNAMLTVQDVAPHPTAPKVAPAPRSPIGLSTATANASLSIVSLRFVDALDADTASDAAHYTVKVNGQAVAVEIAGYNASTHAVSLGLAEGSLYSGDAVVVAWNGLQDGAGRTVTGSVTVK